MKMSSKTEKSPRNTTPIKIKASSMSDIGKVREQNQDIGLDKTAPDAPCDAEALLIVADGMGGHAAGDKASQMATNELDEYLSTTEHGNHDIENILEAAVQHANSAVYEAGKNPDYKGMGTTLTVAIVINSDLYVANVGDSRCYLYTGGELKQITLDHSYVEEQVRSGNLTPEKARTHPYRNIVTRAIGLDTLVKVDIFREKIKVGDRILLCSDGLYPLVPDSEIIGPLEYDDPNRACEKLVDMANDNGGNDNITVAVGIVEKARKTKKTNSKPTKTKRKIDSTNIGFMRRLLGKLTLRKN